MGKIGGILLKSALVGIVIAAIDLGFAETDKRRRPVILISLAVVFFLIAFVVEIGLEKVTDVVVKAESK